MAGRRGRRSRENKRSIAVDEKKWSDIEMAAATLKVHRRRRVDGLRRGLPISIVRENSTSLLATLLFVAR